MNWNKKGYCDVNRGSPTAKVAKKTSSNAWNSNQWYNNPTDCTNNGYEWYEVSHADNLNLGNNSFVCAHTQYSRVNHLGNGRDDSIVSQSQSTSAVGTLSKKDVQGVNANRFLWVVPKIPTMSPRFASNPSLYFPDMTRAYKSCILRIRYNVSTADFPQWPAAAVDPGSPTMVDHRNNTNTKSDPDTPLNQNPFVYISPGDTQYTGDMFVSLRVNTNQYGRTFQDRSYVFSIRPLPTANASTSNLYDTPQVDITAIQNAIAHGGQIFNVNVRGKRGNIVQVFPSVEYDFVPDALALGVHDMVHFQWTGSDYNPRRGCKYNIHYHACVCVCNYILV